MNKRTITGDNCGICGKNIYYKNKKVCVTCYMAAKNKQKENNTGWPKRINLKEAMKDVWYD